MRNLIAAIDLGTTKVACLVGEKTLYGIKIIAYGQAPSKGVLRGEVVNIQHVLDSMRPVVMEVEAAIGEKLNEVFVGIAGQHIRCCSSASETTRKNPEELITKEEIDNITQDKYGMFLQNGEKVLHVIPQSYNIDDFMGVTEPVGMIGSQICANFKMFVGKSNSAQFSRNVISRAGLTLNELILEPLASAKAVLSDEEQEVGVVMVDIGGGTTDLLVVQDNIIRHTAVIPFGGNIITEDIRTGCGISFKYAEQLKIQYGSCYSEYAPANKTIIIPGIGGRESREISFKVLSGIIEARVTEIFEAVAYEIERSGYKDQIKGGIVLTGGSAQLQNIRDLSNLVTGMETRVAAPGSDIITSDSVEQVFHPGMSTAVGLVLKGFEKLSSGTAVETTVEAKPHPAETETAAVQELQPVETDAGTVSPEKEKPAGKKSGRNFWGFLKDSISTEKMFKPDNDA